MSRTNLTLLIQSVPLATEPGISLIILTPMKILQWNLNRSTFVVWEMKRNVSVVHVIVATRSRGKEMPGSVASGTHCICDTVLNRSAWKICCRNCGIPLPQGSLFYLLCSGPWLILLMLSFVDRNPTSFGKCCARWWRSSLPPLPEQGAPQESDTLQTYAFWVLVWTLMVLCFINC
jgi:hypothetical protein